MRDFYFAEIKNHKWGRLRYQKTITSPQMGTLALRK